MLAGQQSKKVFLYSFLQFHINIVSAIQKSHDA